jgi:pimeloyl-ACP methyl ester carboxylesterase
MSTFVLVHGGWRGAWTWEAVVPLLQRAGHTAYTMTLTGVGRDDAGGANLDTHVDDVLRVLDDNNISDAVLVGHSYGGMVISVATDRACGRVSRVVHLDAYVPRDGESWWAASNQVFRELAVNGAAGNGYSVNPPRGAHPRSRSHPLASFVQAARITGAYEASTREFVFCSAWEDTPFAELRDRLRADPEWTVHEVPTAHDLPNIAPDTVAAILLGTYVADSKAGSAR